MTRLQARRIHLLRLADELACLPLSAYYKDTGWRVWELTCIAMEAFERNERALLAELAETKG